MNAKTDLADDSSQLTVNRIIHNSSRSFSLASSFLPKSVRQDARALYAWCRLVDDAVDQASNRSKAESLLSDLSDDVKRCRQGITPLCPASQWIAPLIASRKIDPKHAEDLLEGMKMDLRGDVVKNDEDLEKYCYHVAGTVGLMMTSLMGVQSHLAGKPAIALGTAMQMTNIARDVREDAELGRSYLPGISKVLEAEPSEIRFAVEKILKKAELHYETAIEGLHFLPRSCRFAIRAALELYREIGRQIRRNGFSVLERRTVLGKRRIAFVTARAATNSLLLELTLSLKSASSYFSPTRKVFTMDDSSDTTDSRSDANFNQVMHLALLGLSLTCIMATALFVLVYINPKSVSYAYLPLIYAGFSLIAAVVFNRLSALYEKRDRQQA